MIKKYDRKLSPILTESITFDDLAIFVKLGRITLFTYVVGSATLAEGGNVNQRFINSQVNVVAGDQIHGNIIIYNIVSPEVETSPSNQGECNDILYNSVS